jgi:hypothetical protein
VGLLGGHRNISPFLVANSPSYRSRYVCVLALYVGMCSRIYSVHAYMPKVTLFTSNASTLKVKGDACKQSFAPSDQAASWNLHRGKMFVSSPPHHPGQSSGPRSLLFIGLQGTVYPGDIQY